MAKETNKKEKTKETKARKRLVLLDTHAIVHRAYHALPEFSSSKGEATGALYGLSTMLMKIIAELKPDYIAACYDLPGGTFRHEAYDAYKAGRKKADDELVAQLIRSRDVFKAFSIPTYEAPGFEADDLLGTIAGRMKERGVDVIIASGDMDTLQLVDDERVRVYTLKKGIQDTILYDEKAVIERFGFTPDLLPDYKGLRGDPSDNIIGIRGIGEKTAEELIKNFGGIEDIYKALKKDEKILEKAGIKPRIIELLKNGEEEAQFSKTLALIRRDAPVSYELPKLEWKEELNPEKVIALFDELEFRSLQARAMSLFRREGAGNLSLLSVASPKEELQEEVNPLELSETAVALWLLDSNITDPSLEDIKRFAKAKTFSEARKKILEDLSKNKLDFVFEEIERPLVPIVATMEKIGIRIDTDYLEALSNEYHTELSKLEKKIFAHAGQEFNINSPRQLGDIVFEKMGLSVKNHKKTGGGAKSTRESELEKMKDLHPIIADILSYRELQKLLSTYIDAIPKSVADDGRLHARFIQAGTTTGRMSSQNPNLQNIPTKTELGRKIRDAFVADQGYLLAAFDYSQIELRAAAFLSGDEKLLDIFRGGGDVHAAVASEVFGVPPEKVDKEMRRQAKVINFGILYGMGVNALKANLGSDRETAQKFYNQYFETFTTLAAYLDRVKADASRTGYTETFFGRRRVMEGMRSKIPFVRAAAERAAINAPIQGTEADIIKLAMVKIDEHLKKAGEEDDVRLLLQVHDELVYEVREEKADKISREIKKIMENIIDPSKIGGITLSTNTSLGKNWGEMK